MKTLNILFATVAVAVVGACENAPSQEAPLSGSDAAAVSTYVDTPHVEVQVNKRYDDQGNLIAYDSTYSSFYSTPHWGHAVDG